MLEDTNKEIVDKNQSVDLNSLVESIMNDFNDVDEEELESQLEATMVDDIEDSVGNESEELFVDDTVDSDISDIFSDL